MKILVAALCLVLVFGACKKSGMPTYTSTGTITGYDPGACAACGGLEIIIKNDPTTNPPSFYRINKTLPELGISESTAFPINISLNWKRDTTSQGAANFIIIS